MGSELRPVTEDEAPAFVTAVEAAFGMQPPEEEVEDWCRVLELDRTLAVFEGGAIVGTAGAFSFDLALPGGTSAPAAGVTAVGVAPTHRRRGLLRRMMTRQLDDVAERGEPLAILTASEGVIYGRFGYGPAASVTFWRMGTVGAALAPPAAPQGRLRLVDATEAGKVLPGVYEAARRRHPGSVSRSDAWWANELLDRERHRDGASKRFYVVHESEGGAPDGYAHYRVKGDWEHGRPAKTLLLGELYGLDDGIEAQLWSYLLDVDLVTNLVAVGRPAEEPLRWRLDDPRRIVITDLIDHLWVRLVDVPGALEARRYAVDDALVLELVDPFRPANDGRYLLEGGPDGAVCRRTDRGADLVLGAAELGSVYLGGVAPSMLARAGRIEERTAGALGRADRLLAATPPPWCNTEF